MEFDEELDSLGVHLVDKDGMLVHKTLVDLGFAAGPVETAQAVDEEETEPVLQESSLEYDSGVDVEPWNPLLDEFREGGLLSTGQLSKIGKLLLPVKSICIFKDLIFPSLCCRLYSLFGHMSYFFMVSSSLAGKLC